MAKYRVLTTSHIHNAIVEAGEIVEYDGKPGSNLELVEADKPEGKGKGKAKGAVSADADSGSDLV